MAGLAYLLASALSGLMHSHAHGPSHAEVSDSRANDQALSLDQHLVAPAGHDDHSPPVPVSDDDCLACRFVAQCALVSMPAPEPGLTPLVVELPCPALRYFVEPLRLSGLARAPPIG